MRVLVTGGAGFIGSALVRMLIRETTWEVLNLDKLTYAGNLESLRTIEDDPSYQFQRGCITDATLLAEVFTRFRPTAVFHLAAESHVDRSIDGPAEFIHTNIVGTYTLLQAARQYWEALEESERDGFRFLHVSTDEVYGSLGKDGYFTETTPYDPHSPYSASKASSDHLARSWHHTFGLPVLVTNCSNNYGPYQFPEKLIPLMIQNGLLGKPLPVYGKGENVRDWLFVEDHVRALKLVVESGTPGETYNIGGDSERRNLDVVKTICRILDDVAPSEHGNPRENLIEFVTDRPGHDFRYAIDASKIQTELGWKPTETFESGIKRTVQWYLENQEWCGNVLSGKYAGERLGLK